MKYWKCSGQIETNKKSLNYPIQLIFLIIGLLRFFLSRKNAVQFSMQFLVLERLTKLCFSQLIKQYMHTYIDNRHHIGHVIKSRRVG